MSSEQMYQAVILDYYRNPRNFGTLENPDIKARDTNPFCGDVIEMHAEVQDGRIAEIRFTGKGCAISRAAASMLTELIQGKSLEEAARVTKEEILEVLSIPISGIRLKCALLGLKVFKLGLYDYIGKAKEEETDGNKAPALT